MRQIRYSNLFVILKILFIANVQNVCSMNLDILYNELQTLESKINWLDNADDDTCKYNDIVLGYANGESMNAAKPLLYFGKLSFEQTVANMVSILQTKINCRGICDTPYRTKYLPKIESSDDEIEAEPLPTNLHMGPDLFFHFTLNYNGEYSSQPGNSIIRQSVRYGNYNRYSPCISYRAEDYLDCLQYNTPLRNLLFALEVARRKVVDYFRGVADEFCHLPIFYASCMALKLIENRQIEAKDFWIREKKYHIYTGSEESRTQGIMNILNEYIKIYEIENLDKFLDSFLDE